MGWGAACLSPTDETIANANDASNEPSSSCDEEAAAAPTEAHGGVNLNLNRIDPPMRKAASHNNASILLAGDTPSNNSTAEEEDGTVVDDVSISMEENAATGEANSSQKRPFIAALFVICFVGMAMAVFTSLALGKTGLYFSQSIFDVAGFAVIDLATSINDPLTAVSSTSESNIQIRITKCAVCWLAIGLLKGTVNTLAYLSFEPKHASTIWQPEPMLYDFVLIFVCNIFLIGGVMLQAHRDRRPTLFIWYCAFMSFYGLSLFGGYSPYSWISALGGMLGLANNTVGLYLVVMHVDKKTKRGDVVRGYTLLVGLGMFGLQFFTLYITSLKQDFGVFGVFVVSVALMGFQKVCLKIFVPVCKKCFGEEDNIKLWSYPIPAFVLALELGPCLLLLGEDLTTWNFWALLAWQECNSVAKNTGKFDDLYVAVCARLGRPVNDEKLILMEERRAILAPCENIGEITAPVIILVAIGLEGLFDALPIERAPYLADANEGVLGAWRMQRYQGEAPIMMTGVLAVRLIFCWIELTLRAHVRGGSNNKDTDNNTGGSDGNADVSGDQSAPRHAKRRKSSMSILYTRIVRSQEATVEMQYMAGGSFVLQAVQFVLYAAAIGKKSGN